MGLLVAIFVSNLPEAIGSSTDMAAGGRSKRSILWLWVGVAVACTLASVVGYGAADSVSGDLKAVINGFAAGALLVMLIDSMIPEAAKKGGRRPASSPCSASPSPSRSPSRAPSRRRIALGLEVDVLTPNG